MKISTPRILKNADEMILSEKIFFERIFYSFVLVIMIIVSYFIFAFSGVLFFVSVFPVIGILIFKVVTGESFIIRVNKKKQTLFVSRQSLIKHSFDSYEFAQIEHLIYLNEIQTKQGIDWQLIIPLKSGSLIRLFPVNRFSKDEYFKMARLINEYVFDERKRIS